MILLKRKILFILIAAVIIITVIISMHFGLKIYKKNMIKNGYESGINPVNYHAIDVTMVQLLANPDKYDGELVRVIGVGNLEFEGNYIALSMDDWKYRTGNYIWIRLGDRAIPYEEAQQYNGKYVLVEGFFDKDDSGHLSLFHGAITNVSRYQLWDHERIEETE